MRVETSPEDLRGMIAAEGILTARGGVSSHAALVARQMGKVCVCGASALEVNYDKRTLTVGSLGKRIDASRKVVLPGLINAHTHFYSTFARGLTKNKARWVSLATSSRTCGGGSTRH